MGSDSYQVSARKHRPQSFDDLVSQSHVTGTLQNAIKRNRVGQAYLFSGPRGVGKTTVARLLAKAINCQTEVDKRDNAEPCGTCESCKTIGEGRSLNIIEIDAASNNGVDDARDLRETVRIPPQGALKKVYIIDEVHMMSNAAFNALLKTLEEPPDYVHFIFATTEPKKVLATILSRCQRFNFRRISFQETFERLKHICELENIKADDASLMLLAQKGDGALRDALSAFDQAISLCGTDIKYEELSAALGLIDNDRYFEVSSLIADKNRSELILILDRIIAEGFDLEEFVSGLAEHLRNLYLTSSMNSTELVDADSETKQRYQSEAEKFSETDLMRLLMIASDTEDGIRRSLHPRLKLELGILKMASLSSTSELSSLLSQLTDLNKIQNKLPTPKTTPPTSTAKPPIKKSPVVSSKSEVADSQEAFSTAGSAAVKLENVMAPQSEEAPLEMEPEPMAAAKTVAEPVAEPVAEKDTNIEASPEPKKRRPTLFGKPALEKAPEVSLKTENSGVETDAPKAIVKELNPEIVQLNNVWNPFCIAVINDRLQVGALLKHTTVEAFNKGTVQILVPDEFHQKILRQESTYLIGELQKLVKDFEVQELSIITNEKSDIVDTIENSEEVLQEKILDKIKTENPLINDLLDRFDATLVW